MNLAEIKTRWLASKAGTVSAEDVCEVFRTAEGSWCKCPCGGDDHTALHRGVVLTCFVTDQQWFVVSDGSEFINAHRIAGILRTEEQTYLDLLARADRLVPQVVRQRGASEATLAFLHDTHGIPPDVARPLMGA